MRQCMTVLAAIVVALFSADTVSAIPAFAQRYKVECHMCHDGFPKLTKTGHRFKERGFRLENEDPFQASDWLNSIPVRARLSATRSFVEDGDSFDYAFLKLISAGNLGPRVSYWIDDGFFFDDNDNSKTHLKPDNAWARFEILPKGKLYARGGRIELDIPFTQARTPNLFPYEIYSVNTGFEVDSLASYQHGVELGGLLSDDQMHWSAAVTGGTSDDAGEALSDAAGDFEPNVFLRLARHGENSRVGAFSYIGRNTLARGLSGTVQTWEDKLLRVGGDVDVRMSKLNLYGLYMYGRNSDSVPSAQGAGGSGESATFHGGFVQADLEAFEKDLHGLLKEVELVLTLRANYVRRPFAVLSEQETFSNVYPGARLLVRDRFRLTFEYGFQGQDRANHGAVQAELVF